MTKSGTKRVLITDPLDEEGLRILQAAEGIEVEVKPGLAPDALKAVIGGYHGLVVRSATQVTPDLLDAADALEVIGRAGIGVDNVNVEAASRRGVIVMNTPEGSAVTTAEHAIALLLSIARRIPQATASMKAGKWDKKRFMGTEMAGKTLGIIGIGNIGGIVADRARGLKMNVVACDPYMSEEVAAQKGITLVDIDDLYARADFISIHTPLTKDTKHMVDAAAFAKMKRGVLIVNAARGGIIHEGDLLKALEQGQVGGAALDVWEKEPPGENTLLGRDEVICTPHLGASTEEAQVNVSVAVARQLVEFFTTGTIKNAVNVPSLTREALARIQPFLVLAERLGRFLAQTFEGGVEEFQIEYCGELADFNGLTPVTAAALKGLLAPMLGEKVNFVNAPFLARERGMHIVESRTGESRDFASLIRMKVSGKSGERLVCGTNFGRNNPRIVRIDNFYLEAHAGGHILMMHNEDKPGVVGAVGTLLGKNGINIARMQLGLDSPKREAVALIQVDEPVPDEVLRQFEALPNIISVKQIEL